MLLQKTNRRRLVGERGGWRRLQAVAANEVEARVAIVLHRVGVAAAAEHLVALGAEALVLVDGVVLVPDEVRVAPPLARRHHVGERAFGDEPLADERITREL